MNKRNSKKSNRRPYFHVGESVKVTPITKSDFKAFSGIVTGRGEVRGQTFVVENHKGELYEVDRTEMVSV